MNSTTESEFDAAAISSLIEKCVTLCADAESVSSDLSADRAAFLGSGLEDALQQLELVLSGIGRADDADTGHGFLSRLFARSSDGSEPKASELAPTDLETSTHGLQGNSWTISLAELLGFLAYARKTGVLWVDTPSENFLIGLVDGNRMHASSNDTPEGLRLGEILVGFDFLTQRQLERYLDEHEHDESATSGEMLLERGMISSDELQHALGYQVQQLVYRMVGTKHAVFRFREGMRIELAYQVDLNVDQLLLESARVLDESAHAADTPAATLEALDAWEEQVDLEPAPDTDSDTDAAEDGDEASTEKPAA